MSTPDVISLCLEMFEPKRQVVCSLPHATYKSGTGTDDHNEHPHSDRGRVQQLWNPGRQMLPGSPTLGLGNVLGLLVPGNCSPDPSDFSPGSRFHSLGSPSLPTFPPWPRLRMALENTPSRVAGQPSRPASCLREAGGGGGIQRYLCVSSSHNHF